MSCSSTLTIWKKHTGAKITPEQLDDLKWLYKSCDEKNGWPQESEDEKDDWPMIFDRFYGSYGEFKDKTLAEKRDRFVFMDGSPLDCLVEADFGSSFNEFWDEWSMNGYRHSGSARLVSRDEAQWILQAARYLLNGNYDKQLESALGNEWIRILGEDYPKWGWKKNQSIYADRDMSGHWVISRGDAGYDREAEEENTAKECNLKRLVSILEVFLDQTTFEDGVEFILTYSVSS